MHAKRREKNPGCQCIPNYKRKKRSVRTFSFLQTESFFSFFPDSIVRRLCFAGMVVYRGSFVGFARSFDVVQLDIRDGNELLERMVSEGGGVERWKNAADRSPAGTISTERAPCENYYPWKSNQVARNPSLFRADTLDVAGP